MIISIFMFATVKMQKCCKRTDKFRMDVASSVIKQISDHTHLHPYLGSVKYEKHILLILKTCN